jgi:hypothetical protein
MTRNPLTTIPSPEEIVKAYSIDRIPCIELAKQWNCVPDYVRKLARKYGCEARSHVGLHSNPRSRVKDFIGSMLGDGALFFPNTPHSNARLQILHTIKQREYAEWKYKMFENLSCKFSVFNTSDPKCPTKCSFTLHADPYLSELQHLWYPNGVKTVRYENVTDINSLGLAIWFMDDGYYEPSHGSDACVLCTDAFSKEEQWILRKVLIDNFGIPCTLMNKPNGQFRLRIPHAYMELFREILHPYLLPSMLYKIGC